MSTLDFALRKSETALGRILTTLVLAAIAMLGLVWLSIAAAGWLAYAVAPPVAAAIVGGVFVILAGLAFRLQRSANARSREAAKAAAARLNAADDLMLRATRIAEGMAPDTPLAALAFALLAGVASVALPPTFSPYLAKILDDVEQSPDEKVGT